MSRRRPTTSGPSRLARHFKPVAAMPLTKWLILNGAEEINKSYYKYSSYYGTKK